MRLLFQGDSITDTSRDRAIFKDLGSGYPRMIDQLIKDQMPGQNIECINRGISGNRVIDLENRWQKECIDLQPDILSILIGVNDVWRRYDANDPTSCEAFEAGYRHLLTQVRSETKAKIVMLEPFLLHTTEERKSWREDLDPKIAAVRRLAEEFADVFIAYDEVFAKESEHKSPAYWAEDGVHPTEAGHNLIAKVWFDQVKKAGLI